MADTLTHGSRRSRSDDTMLDASFLRRPSWGAVVAGTVVACSAQVLFYLLGAALGMSLADNAAETHNGLNKMAAGAAGWWLVTGTLAMFLGGLVVGRYAGLKHRWDVAIHALTVWAATAVLGAMTVAGGAGMITGSAVGMLPSVSQTMQNRTSANPNSGALPGSDLGARDLTPEEQAAAETAREYARNVSWLTFGGLVLGIIATVLGAWLAAKDTPWALPFRDRETVNPTPVRSTP